MRPDPFGHHRRRHHRRHSQQLPESWLGVIDPRDTRTTRSYFGGPPSPSALRTVFFEIPIIPAITLIGTPAARCNRRVSTPVLH
ncbi:hypothetical protein ASG90_13605 [Nocardioides sp. Soil797]|nr:hypothetical protein ASG90_13605 [Nocardioides sp. Soil797]